MKKKSNKPTKTKSKMKKTMRFLSMAALALVGAVTVGCSSDDNIIDEPQQPTSKSNVVTLTTTISLDGGAATTRSLTSGGVKTFAAGETMAIYYYKNKGNDHEKAVSAPLTAGDITNGGKSATFTFTLDNPYKDQSVVYIYPAAMANADFTPNYDALYNNQDGTLATLASNFDFCTKSGAWNGENLPSLTLENQLAILALTLKNSTGSSDITSTITGVTITDGTNTYAITRSATDGPIYVAIRPTTSADITVTATDGTNNYTKSLTGKTYAKGNGYPVSWRMTEVVDPNLLSGIFSVSSTKKVKFSKGNLRYASGTWSFFDNQYDYYTSYSADAWDKFGWSTSAITYGMNTSTDNSTYSSNFKDWGATIGTGWRTLTSAEWTYVFSTRTTGGTVFGTSSARYAHATINTDGTGVNGIILFPDGVDIASSEVTTAGTVNATSAYATKCATAQWSALAAKGCVFLPAAGYRTGSSVYFAGSYGLYWSSSPNGTSSAYNVYFSSGDLNPAGSYSRNYGGSVRLVRDAQ